MDRRAVIVLHVMGWFVSAQAAAQSAEPARAALQVRGPAGCLEPSAIVSQVRARSQRIEFVEQAPDVPLLAVEAQQKPREAVAVELTVSWPDKRRSRRALAADGCEEATSAVAFLIALTLDPQAVFGAEAATPAGGGTTAATSDAAATNAAGASGGTDSGAAATPAGAEATTEGTSGADHAQTRTEMSASPPAANEPDTEETNEPAFFAVDQISVGASAVLASGVAPALMPGFGAHVFLAFHGSGVFAPALQLTAAHAWVNHLAQLGGIADFQRTTVRLDLCPLGLRAGILAARACVSSAAGTLNAQGSDTYVPRTSARGWLDLGTSLRAAARIGPVFQVVAGVVLAFPLRRDEFAFRPDVFHQVAALSWEGQLGLAVRFP